jgi:hypothetical protein
MAIGRAEIARAVRWIVSDGKGYVLCIGYWAIIQGGEGGAIMAAARATSTHPPRQALLRRRLLGGR